MRAKLPFILIALISLPRLAGSGWALSEALLGFLASPAEFIRTACSTEVTERSLPPGLIKVIAELRKLDARDYRLDGDFAGDAFLHQRIAEGAWPLRIDSASRFLVYSPATDRPGPGCKTRVTDKEAALAVCDL